MDKTFNIIITGVGGQGLVKLVQIIDEACFVDGYAFRSSEIHGLAQRGGSVLAHIRFGKKVYSPMVQEGLADLIIATELMEGLRVVRFANKNTKILINKKLISFLGGLVEEDIFKRLPKKNLYLVEAPEKMAGIYLLSFALKNNLLPFKDESVIKAIKKIIPEKFLDNNIKVFNSVF